MRRREERSVERGKVEERGLSTSKKCQATQRHLPQKKRNDCCLRFGLPALYLSLSLHLSLTLSLSVCLLLLPHNTLALAARARLASLSLLLLLLLHYFHFQLFLLVLLLLLRRHFASFVVDLILLRFSVPVPAWLPQPPPWGDAAGNAHFDNISDKIMWQQRSKRAAGSQ